MLPIVKAKKVENTPEKPHDFVSVKVTKDLKARVKQVAKLKGQSVSTFAARALAVAVEGV